MEISIKHRLSHLGSCFTALPILIEIFTRMRKTDKFVLSNGHAGLAYYVVLEHFRGVNAEELLETYGIHPERDLRLGVDVSTGSLGMGLPIAVGMAYANKHIDVYCLISDGECAEGSIWEALQFVSDTKLSNIHIYANLNNVAAYRSVDAHALSQRLLTFYEKINIRFTNVHDVVVFPTDISAHYFTANENMRVTL